MWLDLENQRQRLVNFKYKPDLVRIRKWLVSNWMWTLVFWVKVVCVKKEEQSELIRQYCRKKTEVCKSDLDKICSGMWQLETRTGWSGWRQSMVKAEFSRAASGETGGKESQCLTPKFFTLTHTEATPLVANKSPIVCKLMREWPKLTSLHLN